MKRFIFAIIGACLLLTGLLINFKKSELNNSKTDLLLNNVLAISQAQAEGSSSGYTCWAMYVSCTWWGCTHIWQCGVPCVDKKADSWSAPNTCS